MARFWSSPLERGNTKCASTSFVPVVNRSKARPDSTEVDPWSPLAAELAPSNWRLGWSRLPAVAHQVAVALSSRTATRCRCPGGSASPSLRAMPVVGRSHQLEQEQRHHGPWRPWAASRTAWNALAESVIATLD